MSLATVEDPTELTVALGKTEAEALTERIREHVGVVSSHLRTFDDLLDQAETGRVWEVLNYPDFEAYTKAEFGFGRAQRFRLKRAFKIEAKLSDAVGKPLRLREGQVRGMSDAQIDAVAAEAVEKMRNGTVADHNEIVQEALKQERERSPLAQPRRYAEQPAAVVDAVAAEIADPRIPEDEPIPATRAVPKGRRISDESVLQLADALDRLAGIGVHPEDMARGLTAKQVAMLPSLEDAYEWMTVFYAARASV